MTVPVATYRLQLDPDTGFDAAIDLLDHVAALGISHLYLSPVTEAVPGSTHGYDVTDHTAVRAELGGREGLRRLADAAAGHGLELVIDIVPNHGSVAVPRANRRWWNTLRDGPAAPDAATFDIDWAAGDGKVILPVLARPLDEVLAAGDVGIVDGDEDDGEARLDVAGLVLPLAPGTEHLEVADALERQHYRLVPWRAPGRNVRRFFTIDDLVAIRVERPEVAQMVNALPVELVADGTVAGLRLDHVDGLADPGGFIADLVARVPDAWVVVEKILGPGEELAESWPVAGTTGYDFVLTVDHLLLDPDGEAPLSELWHQVSGDRRPFEEVRAEARAEVLRDGLAPDLERVTAAAERALPDRPAGDIRAALQALTTHIGRYRTYQPDDPEAPAVVAAAADAARRDGTPHTGGSTLGALADQLAHGGTAPARALQVRWQQLTAPVVAKGDEDRAFYRYRRLAALCEVGGEPGLFGTDPSTFHHRAARIQRRRPHTLLAGSTHDTKLSEDVRARLLVLSERPSEWGRLVIDVAERVAERHPDGPRSDIYDALQIAVGAWPVDPDRLGAQLIKAAREAALHTSWTDPDDDHERWLADLARICVTDPAIRPLVEAFVGHVALAGWTNSLSALVLRLTAPGVPDVYQGSETWTDSLVDPDNRRPPDWKALRALARRAAATDAATAWRRPGDGLVKCVVLERTLALRRRRPAAFGAGPDGAHHALGVSGRRADHVVAYSRGTDVVAVVTRRSTGVANGWDGTAVTLPTGSWRNVLVDDGRDWQGTVGAADLLRSSPVAVLERLG